MAETYAVSLAATLAETRPGGHALARVVDELGEGRAGRPFPRLLA